MRLVLLERNTERSERTWREAEQQSDPPEPFGLYRAENGSVFALRPQDVRIYDPTWVVD